MVGRRVPFCAGFPGRSGAPGDYCRVPPGIDPRPDCEWYLVDPQGKAGAILSSLHDVVAHPDGTITVSPSLVMPSGYHGFLRAGVWSP